MPGGPVRAPAAVGMVLIFNIAAYSACALVLRRAMVGPRAKGVLAMRPSACRAGVARMRRRLGIAAAAGAFMACFAVLGPRPIRMALVFSIAANSASALVLRRAVGGPRAEGVLRALRYQSRPGGEQPA